MTKAALLFFVVMFVMIAMNGCASPDTPWLYRSKDDLPPTSTSDKHLIWWEEKEKVKD
jgi:hypothetical protein